MLKKIFSFILLSIVIYGCEVPVHEEYDLYGEHPNDNNITEETGEFKVTIGDALWVAPITAAVLLEDNFGITATDPTSGKTITLTIPSDEIGSYIFNDETEYPDAIAYIPSNSFNDAYICPATDEYDDSVGQIVISAIDTAQKKISGSFHGKAYSGYGNSVNLTNGTFTNISYVTELPPSATNQFYAKVDGVEFIENTIQGVTVTMSGYTDIKITASKNDLSSISLTIPITQSSPGTYNYTGTLTQGEHLAIYNPNQTSSTLCVSGSITITNHNTTDEYIEGTFNFVSQPLTSTTPSYHITNGSFKVHY